MTHACTTHNAYLLTCEQFDELLADGCHRCGGTGSLQIDHDHKLGINAVRGALCRDCNRLIMRVDLRWRDPDALDQRYMAQPWHVGRVTHYRPDNRTPVRTYRVDDELWQAAQAKAKRRRETVASVLKRALVEYVEQHGGDVSG